MYWMGYGKLIGKSNGDSMNFDEACYHAGSILKDDSDKIRDSYMEMKRHQKFLKTMIALAFIKQGFNFPPEYQTVEVAYVEDYIPARTIEYETPDLCVYQSFKISLPDLYTMLVPVVRKYMEDGQLTHISQIVIGKELSKAVIHGRLPYKQFSMGTLFGWTCIYAPTISGIMIL